jgi:DNA-binding transcriptional regulator YiaG
MALSSKNPKNGRRGGAVRASKPNPGGGRVGHASAMTCYECGAATQQTAGTEPLMGLPTVSVDVTVLTCTNGHREVMHHAILRTMETVANTLANKKTQLTGQEIRFLRKQLGLSGQDFAKFMLVTPEWVSKWENEKASMSQANEQRLRTAVQHGVKIFDYDIKIEKKAKPMRMRVGGSQVVHL